ncbi:APH(3') family aminoglycoside O-phosphotransferase [Roseateles sp.]|uniref:APH(3') family aminoglycoside O-phosphotransferase n=1 Tax=Roseateles sp. TaxID=1971397 RepID=UPI003BAC9293
MTRPPTPDLSQTLDEREVPTHAPALPAGLAARLTGHDWHRNLVGEAGASVFRLQCPGTPDLYLKHGRGTVAQDLVDELARLRWLASVDAQGLPSVPAVEHFEYSGGDAWLLTRALPGRTAYQWLTDAPDRSIGIVRALAAALRAWHALPAPSCPFNADHHLRLAQARRRLDAGLVDADDFDADRAGWTPQDVWNAMADLLPLKAERVVTHGDFSLDNLLLDEQGRVTGLIDLGRVGIADPYQDLAVLWNCLAEFGEALQQELFIACGLARPDENRLHFHLYLDECF